MWTKNANLPGTLKSWYGALDYVASMNNGAGTLGYTDWRLPNKKELRSLSDHRMYNPSLLSGHPFTNVQSDVYWSSTTCAGNTSYAWKVYINTGGNVCNYDKSYYHYVWPVRSGQVGDLVNLVISKSGTGDGTITSLPDGRQ
ncbi:MAG: DUF1566 domain-containing protein [Candidatus Magnetobacterium sp. LHC-1]